MVAGDFAHSLGDQLLLLLLGVEVGVRALQVALTVLVLFTTTVGNLRVGVGHGRVLLILLLPLVSCLVVNVGEHCC